MQRDSGPLLQNAKASRRGDSQFEAFLCFAFSRWFALAFFCHFHETSTSEAEKWTQKKLQFLPQPLETVSKSELVPIVCSVYIISPYNKFPWVFFFSLITLINFWIFFYWGSPLTFQAPACYKFGVRGPFHNCFNLAPMPLCVYDFSATLKAVQHSLPDWWRHLDFRCFKTF